MSVFAGTLRTPLLTQVTAGTSQGQPVLPYENLTIYLKGDGTIATGTVIIEEADFAQGYSAGTETWSAVTGASPLDCTMVSGGAQQAYQLPIGVYHYVRARIGTTVTGGGSVSVVLCGN